jgi:hypothetical protein
MTKLTNQLKKRLSAPGGQKMIRRLWVLPAAGILWVLLSYNTRTLGLSGRVDKAIEQYKTMEKQAASALQTPSKTAEEMKKKNLFSGSQPTPPMPQCTGILGNYALFGEEWHKTGDMVQDAKIVSVNPTEVKILWQGKEQILRPFDVEVQYKKSQASGPTPGGQPAAQSQPESPPMPMGGRFGGFDPRNMSPDQLAQMRDRFMNMSSDERRRAFEEMRGQRGQRGQ